MDVDDWFMQDAFLWQSVGFDLRKDMPVSECYLHVCHFCPFCHLRHRGHMLNKAIIKGNDLQPFVC